MNTIYNVFCEFITVDNIHYECKNCGTRVAVQDSIGSPPMFPCKKSLHRSSESEISFSQKIKNFAGAAINHLKTGMPTCTEEQIIKRHDICMTCEFFKEDTCTKCGCPLFRNKMFASKLAWADQECPVGKWKKEI